MKNPRTVTMTQKELTLSQTVICPKCGAFPKKRCKNVETGFYKKCSHLDRLNLAKKPPVVIQPTVNAQVVPFKPDPRAKLTPEQKDVVAVINEKIHALGAHAEFIGPVTVGPIVSTYRFLPKRKTRVSVIENMCKDYAVALGAESILAKRMPGETAVGIFVPNKERKMIQFRDTVQYVMKYWNKPQPDYHIPIPLNLGQDINGNPVVEDLSQLPHLLIAGSTGSGKSTLLHSLLGGMVFPMSSDQLKLVVSDTKQVEFRQFNDLPHLLFGPGSICTDVYKTMSAMQYLIEETERRQQQIAYKNVRNIHEYNAIAEDKMPYIVLVIDELADIMGVAVSSGEAKLNASKLQTIVSRARFTGIHVIAGTQRPDVKAVGGAIKANFPARISFRLPSQVDSRTVINTKGAENLLSKGDMLFYSPHCSELRRLHAPYTEIKDVLACVQYVIHRDSAKEITQDTPEKENNGYVQ